MAACKITDRIKTNLVEMTKLAASYNLGIDWEYNGDINYTFTGEEKDLRDFYNELNAPNTIYNNLTYSFTDKLVVGFKRDFFIDQGVIKFTFEITKDSKGKYWFLEGSYDSLETATAAMRTYFKYIEPTYMSKDAIWEKYYNFPVNTPVSIQLQELDAPSLASSKGYSHRVGKDYIVIHPVKTNSSIIHTYDQLLVKLELNETQLDALLSHLTPKQLKEFKEGKRYNIYATVKGNRLLNSLNSEKVLSLVKNPDLATFNRAIAQLEKRESQIISTLKKAEQRGELESLNALLTELTKVREKKDSYLKKLEDLSNLDELFTQLEADKSNLRNLLETTNSREIGEYVIRTLKGYLYLLQEIDPEIKKTRQAEIDSFLGFYEDMTNLIPQKEQQYLAALYEELQTPAGDLVEGEDVSAIESIIKVATDSKNKLIQLVGKLTLKINALIKSKQAEYQLRMNPLRKELKGIKDRRTFFSQFMQKSGNLLTGNIIVKESYEYFMSKLINSNFYTKHKEYITQLVRNEKLILNGDVAEMQAEVDKYIEKLAQTKYEAGLTDKEVFNKVLSQIDVTLLEEGEHNQFRTILNAYYKYLHERYNSPDITFENGVYSGKLVREIEDGLAGDEVFLVKLLKDGKLKVTDSDILLFPKNIMEAMSETLSYHDRLANLRVTLNIQRFVDYFNENRGSSKIDDNALAYMVAFYRQTNMFRINGVSPFEFEVVNEAKFDPQYVALMNKDPESIERKFYDRMVAELKSAKTESKVGYHVEWNRIPEYYSESRMEGELLKDYAKRKIERTVLSNTTESINVDERVNPLTGKLMKVLHFHRLPNRRRVNTEGENLEELQDKIAQKEWDLEKILDNYVRDINTYIYKKAYEDHINLIVEVGSNQEVLMRRADGTVIRSYGEPQYEKSRRVAEQLEYIRDAYIYGDAHAIEGKEMVSGANQFLQKLVNGKNTREVQGRIVDKEAEARLNDLYSKVPEPDEAKEGRVRAMYDAPDFDYLELDETEKAYARIINYERTLPFATGSKFINWLNKFTAFRMIAYNPFSGLAEFFQFVSTAFIEGYGGEFFTTKDMERAFREGLNIKKDPAKADKMFLISHYFKTEAPTETDSKFAKYGFMFFRWVNTIQDTILGIAMLNHEKINGHSLYDLLKVENGKLVIEGLGAKESEEKLLQLQAKFVEVVRIKRNRTDVHPTQFNKQSLLRLAGLFKYNWMVEGFYNRFSEETDSAILGKREGYYRTALKALKDRVEVTKPDGSTEVVYKMNWLKLPLRMLSVPLAVNFGKYDYSNLTPHEKANIRRSVFEFEMIVLLATAIFFLMSGEDDDEEFMPKAVMNFVLNSMIRLQRDSLTFTDPDSFVSIIKNPIPAASTLTDMVDVMEAGISTMLFDPYISEDDERFKLSKEGFELLPILNVPKKINNKLEEITNYEQ